MWSMCYIFYVFFAKFVVGEIVITSQGALNGTEQYSRDGRLFHSFYGIPYARPPIGKLRFKPPIEPLPWNGTRDATRVPPICSQLALDGEIVGQEDCLFLNVFTPNLKPTKLLPVWVFIHGGVFRIGSAEASPNFIMDHDVVFVTLQYRLGILGFLSTGDHLISGNYGLKDQISALHWIQKNIRHFGGDSRAVTINGMSSGAVCVHLLCFSPKAQGLFHRVILQSGSALSHWSHYAWFEAQNLTTSTVQPFCDIKSDKFVECMQNVSVRDLINTERISDNVFKFIPVIENATSAEAVLTSPPASLDYRDTNITMMIGFTANENDVFLSEHIQHFSRFRLFMLNQLANFFITGCLPVQYKYNSSIRNDLIIKFRQAYFDNQYLNKENIGNFSDLMSDMSIIMPVLDTALTYPGTKYLYMYNYTNPITAKSQKQVPYRGAIHSDDGITLHDYVNAKNLTKKDHQFSRIHITYWANFVSTGNPNANDLLLPVWNSVCSTSLEYLYLSNDVIRMKTEPYKHRYKIWYTSGISVFDSNYYIGEKPPSPGDTDAYEIISSFYWIFSAFKYVIRIVTSIDKEIWQRM